MISGKRISILIYGIAILAVTITALVELDLIYVDSVITPVMRWLAIIGLSYLAWKRKSLTTWILFSMVIGAEFGHDFNYNYSPIILTSTRFFLIPSNSA